MRMRVFFLVIALVLVAALPVAAAGAEKGDVCHITDEVAGTGHVITIAEPAWDSHYDHGDPMEFETFIAEDGSEQCREVTGLCPTTLTASTSGPWFEADAVAGYTTMNMVATFQNEVGRPFLFAVKNGTYDLRWATLGTSPTRTTSQQPNGFVYTGGRFTYNITMDVAGVENDNLQMIIKSINGVEFPSNFSVVGVTFVCE